MAGIILLLLHISSFLIGLPSFAFLIHQLIFPPQTKKLLKEKQMVETMYLDEANQVAKAIDENSKYLQSSDWSIYKGNEQKTHKRWKGK
jgi:hypothetical protein